MDPLTIGLLIFGALAIGFIAGGAAHHDSAGVNIGIGAQDSHHEE